MRTANVFALVTSLLMISGCATNNGTQGGNGFGGNWNAGNQDGSYNPGQEFGNRLHRPLFGRGGDSQESGCSNGDCSNGNCSGGDCSSGNCGTQHSLSDTGFECGPMCGAHLSDEHFSDPTTCDSCEAAPSYVKNQLQGWSQRFAESKVAKRGLLRGKSCRGSSCGSCDECATSRLLPRATCKGLGRGVGCFGCGDCGNGSAIGLNHSGIAAPMAGMNHSSNAAPSAGFYNYGPSGPATGSDQAVARGLFHRPMMQGEGKSCSCIGCLSKGRLGACRFAGSSHPYGGEIPHTAAAANAAGAGPDSSAPTYAYPYYTTRGPRDFLQDGCGPPQIGSSQPQPMCLPTIGR